MLTDTVERQSAGPSGPRGQWPAAERRVRRDRRAGLSARGAERVASYDEMGHIRTGPRKIKEDAIHCGRKAGDDHPARWVERMTSHLAIIE